MDITKRKNFKVGLLVDIVEDGHFEDDYLIRGYIKKILSKEDNSKGIKVLLDNGKKGRVYKIPTRSEVDKDNFIFFNKFLNDNIYALYHKKRKELVYLRDKNKNKFIILFNSTNKFKEYIKDSKLDNRDIIYKKISAKMSLTKYFEKEDIKFYLLNGEKKVLYLKMEQIENFFLNK